MLIKKIQHSWYNKSGLTALLLPLSWLFCLLVQIRRVLYRLRILRTSQLNVPVVVVGNITVGGTGKTPLVIELANLLKEYGYRPGIISRGYGGKARTWPQQVRWDGDPTMVGDEAILIARRTRCPMAVGPDRVASAKALLKYTDCNLIISDDGLQHYALGRDIEIAVIDGVRRYGNGQCLPAGPLREPVKRLEQVNFKITNGIAGPEEFAMAYTAEKLCRADDPAVTLDISSLKNQTVHAIAGIGNPQQFFDQLKLNGLDIIEHAFPDHYPFKKEDLDFGEIQPIVLTEKDAVKCQRFYLHNVWYQPIKAVLDNQFTEQLLVMLERINGQKTS
ncbi:MAG: tetraacyldisaccharide 4'-kinase [Gammaproteobacteria bacterium]|nr:tetraacyldisaccharide 4'-kinase [Gammaproteobacteria bacterium]MCW8988322.1 tetraacyldisaccharide 4'-kinase [Gammaproteobacteria bacterium]MCW9030356.1 tetraacyldisaccharide 4'-kinase [Gammaproteobacteria bacterium]